MEGAVQIDKTDFSEDKSAKDFFNLEKVISYEPTKI